MVHMKEQFAVNTRPLYTLSTVHYLPYSDMYAMFIEGVYNSLAKTKESQIHYARTITS